MKFYTTQKGPNILVECYVKNDVIVKTELKENPKAGFSWGVELSHSSQQALEEISSWMEAYSEGNPKNMGIPLMCKYSTEYTAKIVNLMKEIPFGHTINYKELATRAGSPKGARAAGCACGRNPFPLIVPCHRVLAVGGKIGGFSCGIEIKKRLLIFEGVLAS